MFRRFLPIIAVLLLGSSTLSAQPNIDAWLPTNSQFYFSWDGVAAHRDNFRKSAVGKTLQGDTGRLLAELVKFAEAQWTRGEQEAGGNAAVTFKTAVQVCETIGSNGFRAALSLDGILPPNIEAMLILPNAAADKSDLRPLLAGLAARAGLEVAELKIGDRHIHKLEMRPFEIGWWNEQGHLIFSVNNTGMKHAVARVAGTGANLTQYPLYKQVTGFDGFPVWARGYIDLEGVVNQVSILAPAARQGIDDLGLKNLKSITLQSGFDGPAGRSIVEIHVPGPRRGILRLANQRKIKLTDLPPMPVDANVIAASGLDVSQAYDVVLDSIESVVKTISPKEAQQLKSAMQIAEALLGITLRDDLTAPLGDLVMYYSSPTEIPLGLGGVYLVKVKDEATMNKTLGRLINLAGGIPGVEVRVKSTKYRGAVINSVAINQEGNFQAPSFTVYKGWLVFSYYPQPVQGFVLRMNGELPGWKANKSIEKTLSNLPAEFTAVSISDPRPTVKLILSLAPMGVAALNGALANSAPHLQFDVGLIPNAHEATRHLFPNATVVTDDGTRIRIETRSSILLPF